MKVSRHYLGKFVAIQWKDPAGQMKRQALRDAPSGRAALATWREYGVIDNITDGVVRIVHSAGADAGMPADATDEICYTVVEESLIEKISVYAPAPEGEVTA